MRVLKANILVLLVGSLAFTSCEKGKMCINGEGEKVTRYLDVSEFTEIDLTEAGNVYISHGEKQEVKVVSTQNIIDRLETKVNGNRWEIELEKGCYKKYDLDVYITLPHLTGVYLSGSGNIVVNDFEGQGDLDINISGSGDIELNTFNGCQNLDVRISGSGDISGFGLFESLNNTNVNISGSGKYNGFPVNTKDCDIHISGSGSVNVNVQSTLNIDISGSGNVNYKGTPAISTNISGSGNVVNVN